MIVIKDETCTTIQCKNLVGDNGETCDLCFKVLNNRFALIQQCPYCLAKIDLMEQARKMAISEGVSL